MIRVSDFRTGMSGACMSIKYLRAGMLPKVIYVDPLDGDGYVKYIPERTCKNVTKHYAYGFKCSLCDFEQYDGNTLISFDYEYCPNCGARVMQDAD